MHVSTKSEQAPSDRRFSGLDPARCFIPSWLKRNSSGYASLYAKELRRTVPAHRLTYMLTVGLPAPGEMVLHRCGNAGCINPHHLYTGSDRENLRDKVLHQAARASAIEQSDCVAADLVWKPIPIALSEERSSRGLAFEGFSEVGCFLAPWLHETTDGFRQLAGRVMAGDTVGAHRKIFALFNGPLQKLEILRHSCGNATCLNPFHLEVCGMHASELDFDARHDKRFKINSKGLEVVADLTRHAWAVAQELGLHPQTVATKRAELAVAKSRRTK